MTDKNEFNIETIAHLSMLKLSAEEKELFRKDLAEIIEFAESITDLNLSKDSFPSKETLLKNIFRDDVISNAYDRRELLQNAENDGIYISVPKILEGN